MRDYRLGDDIDDFCVRCKRLTNHLVVSVMNGGPAKVRCRTCHSDHDYRHEQPPPPKVDLRKQALFNEVLKKVDPAAAAADTAEIAALETVPVEAVPVEAVPMEAVPAEAEPVAVEAASAVKAPKAKAKAKGKGRK
jgi:hypothetical protein